MTISLPPNAFRFTTKIEAYHTHCLMMGLDKATAQECLDQASGEAMRSPRGVDWTIQRAKKLALFAAWNQSEEDRQNAK